MVQRKEPEIRRSQQAKLERQSSSQHHQDDLKKKMKLQRSIRAADLESLKDSPPTKPKKRSPAARGSPNYMKPTSSSDAKKEQLQVTTDKKRIPKNSKNSSTLPVSLSRQSSLKAILPLIKKSLIKGVVVNRATCSSTLKDMRFPEALDLDPGGTEAEGTSVMRVCPYTYCSLNGHRHEPFPLLKCFVYARRKLLKAQKSMKLKGLNLLRAKVTEKDKVKVPSGLEVDTPVEEEPEDFFVEIYATGSTEEQVVNEIVGDGEDHSSEFSMNFVEYVECDQQAEEAEEEKRPRLVPEENEGSPIPDNIIECSECRDGCPAPMPPRAESSIDDEAEANTEQQQQEVNQEDAGDSDTVSSCGEIATVDEPAAELKQELYQEVAEAMDPDDGNSEGNDTKSHGEELSRDDVLDQEPESSEEESESEVEGANLLSTVQLFNSSDKHEELASNESDESVAGETWESENEQEGINPLEGTTTEPKARRRDTWKKKKKKKITEEQDDIREFNPRAPNFLDVEPDPEAEKVDLRHQMMDERKNAEEYLIDFALRRAVTKLAPDRKKKVALLVEAFETVMPLPVYEKPLQRAVSEFILTRMQACS